MDSSRPRLHKSVELEKQLGLWKIFADPHPESHWSSWAVGNNQKNQASVIAGLDHLVSVIEALVNLRELSDQDEGV